MKPGTKKKIKNGLRLGLGMGLFLIAAMLIGITIDGLHAGSGHPRNWSDYTIAAGIIVVASLILVPTARVWILYIGGCLLFALPKLLVAIISGRTFYPPHESFSRVQAAELGLFSLLSLFLIYRVTVSHVPGNIDRIAFTFFLLAFVLGFSNQDFTAIIWQLAGLAGLSVAWLLSRTRSRKRHLTLR